MSRQATIAAAVIDELLELDVNRCSSVDAIVRFRGELAHAPFSSGRTCTSTSAGRPHATQCSSWTQYVMERGTDIKGGIHSSVISYSGLVE